MISLELTFVSGDGGFSSDPLTYRQVKRTANVAIYERSRDGVVKDYEVFLIKVDPKGTVQKFPDVVKKDANGKVISRTPGAVKVLEDDVEKYPSTGQFGHIAWSYGNLTSAERRFEKACGEADAPEEVAKVITLPVGEFSTTDLATANGVPYSQAAQFVKAGLEDKSIVFTREERRAAKGKATKLYSKA